MGSHRGGRVEDDQACDHLPASAMLHLHSGGRRAGSAEWAEALSPSSGRGALLVHRASEPPLSAGRRPREKSDHWTHFTDENSRSGELGNVPRVTWSEHQFAAHGLPLCYVLHVGSKCQLLRFSLVPMWLINRRDVTGVSGLVPATLGFIWCFLAKLSR